SYGEENEKLDDLIEQQAKNITGIAEDKEALKVSMCRRSTKYGRIGAGWAKKNRKMEELAILKRKFSTVFKLKDSEAIAICKNIRKVLFDNLAALVSYEILMAQVTEIDDAIAAFENFTGAPTNAIDEREQATTSLDLQFDNVDEVVETMADLIMHWQDSNPNMLLEFQNAKEVDDIGGRLTVVEFNVTKNGNPVFDALITDSKSLKTDRTDYDGKGAIKSVRSGKRPFSINGNGEGSKEELVNVIRGKKITVNVEL
ncbi:MAG TPA: hypothetical protein VJY62_07530, partial [Bacteroidia bacterium]|nr:hypothetical protein [Bacteroidia bacterium]